MLFKDVAHLYLGCEFWDSQADRGEEIAIISGVQKYNGFVYINDQHGNLEIEIKDAKPILTRPWELPESLLKDVIRTRYGKSHEIHIEQPEDSTLCFIYSCSLRGITMIKRERLWWDELSPKQFTILLKAGADLFNLIDSGEAIDSKTLNPTP